LKSICFSVVILVAVVATPPYPAARANQLAALQSDRGSGEQQRGQVAKPPVSFAAATTYGTGGYLAASVLLADVNNDGRLDLVVANNCQYGGGCANGDVSVLLGNGDGTFQNAVSFDAGYEPRAIAVADVNGDGLPDLVVANLCENESCSNGGVSILLGNGDGTFRPPVTYSSGGYEATSVTIADVNGDGHPDVVVANLCEGGPCVSVVSVLLGNGDGSFRQPVGYSSGGEEALSVAIGDMNGDGFPDVVVANESQTGYPSDGDVSVLLGNGDGTFRNPVSYGSGGYIASLLAIKDLNNDGRLDVVVVNACQNSATCTAPGTGGEVGVLLGNGDGTLQTASTFSSGGYEARAVTIGDVNGDGKADLVVANECRTVACTKGGISVFPGNGDGTFQEPASYSSGAAYAVSAALGDVNRDGKIDVAVANEQTNNKSNGIGRVGLLLNNFTTTTSTIVVSSPNPSRVNQSILLTATVTSASEVPDGSQVTFSSSKTVLGTGATNNGIASLALSFPSAKTYTIKATYSGDIFHKASLGTVKQVVTR